MDTDGNHTTDVTGGTVQPSFDRVLFGAAYYNEYQPYERLKTDLDLMVDAHFSVIRVGESVWSTWEPDNGRFDLDWLEPVLDGAHERGISVLLGTPTYAVPPWLVRLYPEITGERATGQRIGWGARQEADFTHPGFRFHAERVIRKIMERYADHPAVIGFQLDNEPGNELLHNHGVFQRFVDYLRLTYGDVETLNEEWGLVYWSHRLTSWADLWPPDGNVQPQYDVAWRRFQAQQTTEFIAWQAGIVREYSRPDQFVTTCIAYERPAVEDNEITNALDVTAGNPYYAMQDGLMLPDQSHAGQFWSSTGTWALYLSADRMYSSRQEPFLVTETNAHSIGFPWSIRPAFDGQWRQAAWALISRGATMIEYWHWHTLHFGAETYWCGVLPHNGKPGRTYREIARIGEELKTAGELVAGLIPDADVAMVYSMPSKWLMQKYPPLARDDGRPDARAYHGLFDPFYRGAFDAGQQVRILHAAQLAEDPAALAAQHSVLVVPGLYIADDSLLDHLAAYAAAGGHLIIGPRTAYADREGRARTDLMPARLQEAAGVWYDEFSSLSDPVKVVSTSAAGLTLDDDAAGTRWIDGLQADGADVLAEYEHPHFGQWPAVTSRPHGQGRVTHVGTEPNLAMAKALLRWAVPHSEPNWRSTSATITSTGATGRDGRRVRFLHNWSWETAAVNLPVACRDVLQDQQRLSAGTLITLGAWDVRVFLEV